MKIWVCVQSTAVWPKLCALKCESYSLMPIRAPHCQTKEHSMGVSRNIEVVLLLKPYMRLSTILHRASDLSTS